MYQSAQWVQNLPVREVKVLPERVLPCARHEKAPAWDEFQEFPYDAVRPGSFHDEDLESVRWWLFEGSCQPRVSMTHKAEVEKFRLRSPAGRCEWSRRQRLWLMLPSYWLTSANPSTVLDSPRR